MNYIECPSVNFDSREGHAIDMLVLHYTGMPSGEEALKRMCDENAKVSAHYMIEETGDMFQLVAEADRAWHAGKSHWRGHDNINQRSIGIEIVNPGHEFGYRPFTDIQMRSVQELCHEIIALHDIPARNVVGHSDIAPTRKEDPGELFNWQWLASEGIGLWPRVCGDSAPARKLTDYGYDISDMPKAIIAFQRHFRPKLLCGTWDEECGQLLAGLLMQV
ncbi:MAG: N-acetylmuramoyl-L-alanine amidase [Alphaproteobacteria bacterium]